MDADALAALELPAITARLANAASTELGSGRARVLQPETDAAAVQERQALTAEGVALLDAGVDPPLAGIKDVRAAVDRAERDGMLGAAELRAIASAVRVALEARRTVAAERAIAPLLDDRLSLVDPALAPAADEIDRCVEEDGSDVRDGASPLLRRLRRELRNGGARGRGGGGRAAPPPP